MENDALLADLRSMPAEARIMYLENAEEEDLQQLLIEHHKGKNADMPTSKWIQILLDI